MSILHRWRIVTPLVLALLSLLVVTSGVSAASATSTHFHFFASGSVLSENGSILPNRVCDITSIPLAGANGVGNSAVSTGACHQDLDTDFTFMGNNVDNVNFAPFTGYILRLSFQFGNVTIRTAHSARTGRTETDADSESVKYEAIPAKLVSGVWTPSGAPTIVLLTTEQIQTSAAAACKAEGHGSIANATTANSFPYNDLLVRQGGALGSLVHVSPTGSQNESFPIGTGVSTLASLFTFNESRVFNDGGIASAHVIALHIVTTFNGIVIVNTSINTLAAGLHCARGLNSNETLSL